MPPSSNQRLLSDFVIDRNNHWNLIRFVLATFVLISHSVALTTGRPQDEPLRSVLGISLGRIAVDLFFVASGFLVTASLAKSGDIRGFVISRALRIYPALIASTLFSVFVVGLALTELGAAEYLATTQTYKYIAYCCTALFGVQYELPGLFHNNPFPNAVNGSLWTLPFELKMYALLALVWAASAAIGKRLDKNLFPIFSLLASIFFFSTFLFLPESDHRNTVARLGYFFFAGASIQLFKHHIPTRALLPGVAFLLLVASYWTGSSFQVIYALAAPYLILWLAYIPKGGALYFNKLGDYSFGMYLYAFPIQQSVAEVLKPSDSVVAALISFILTFSISCVSWHLLEEKCLRLKEKLVRR
jgi:peptidoglycan/LPS O-acetylase OafA/YrhL